MAPKVSRQRLSSLLGRAVPQTVSQLTGGLPSSSFFTPSTTLSSDTLQFSNGDSQTTTAVSTTPRVATPTTAASSSSSSSTPASTSVNAASSNPASKTPTTLAASSLSSNVSRTNASSNPNLHPTTANNSIVLAGSVLPKNTTTTSPQLSATSQPSASQPSRDISSAPLVRNTLPPNLIEAIVVVALALALIIGGIFFYCFKIKRREKRLATSQEGPHDQSTLRHTRSRSGSSISSNRVLNWPIDKKTIKFKKKTDSIISFGPGPEPTSAVTLTEPPQQAHAPKYDQHAFFDDTLESSSDLYEPSKAGETQTSYYGAGDEISHIPISYERKPSSNQNGRPTPPAHPSDDIIRHLAIKKASPKRYNRISKAARKLVPARLVTGVGIGKRVESVHPLPQLPSKYHPSNFPHPSNSKSVSDNTASIYPDENYPTNYSYYQR